MSGFSTLLIPPDLREDVLYGGAEMIEKEVITTTPSSSSASPLPHSGPAPFRPPADTTSVKQYHMHLFDEEERHEKLQQLREEEHQLLHTHPSPPAHGNNSSNSSNSRKEETHVALVRCRQLHEAYLRQLEWARGVVQQDKRLVQWLTCPTDPTLWPCIEKMEEAIEAAAALRELVDMPPDEAGATALRQAMGILRAEATHPGLYPITPVHVAGTLVPYFTSSSTSEAPPSPVPLSSSSSSKTFTQGDPAAVNHGTTLFRLQPSSRVFSVSDVLALPLTTKALRCLVELLTPPLLPPAWPSLPLSASASTPFSSASCTPEALTIRWRQLTQLHLSYFQAGATRQCMGSVQDVMASWWAMAQDHPRRGGGGPAPRMSREEGTREEVETCLAQRLHTLPHLPRRDVPLSASASTHEGKKGVGGGHRSLPSPHAVEQEGRIRLQGGVYASVLSFPHAIVVCVRGAAEVLGGLEEVKATEEDTPSFPTGTGRPSLASTGGGGHRPRRRSPRYRRFITAPFVVDRVLPAAVQATLEPYLQMPVREALARGTLVLVGKPHSASPFSGEADGARPPRPLPPRQRAEGEAGGGRTIPHETKEEKDISFSVASSASFGMASDVSPEIFQPPTLEELEQVARQYLLSPVVLDRVGSDAPLLVSAEKSGAVGHHHHHLRHSPPTTTESATHSSPPDDLSHTKAMKNESDTERMTEPHQEEGNGPKKRRRAQDKEEEEEASHGRKKERFDEVESVKKEPEDLAGDAFVSSEAKEQGKEAPKTGGGAAWCQYQRLPLEETTCTAAASSTKKAFFAYRFRMPFNRFLVFHGRHVEGGFQGRPPVLQKMKAEQEERLEAMAEEAWRDSLRRTASSGGGGGEERGGSGASIGNREGLPASSFASPSVPLTGAALRGAVEKAVMKVLAIEPLSKADLLAHTELRPYAGSSYLEPVVKAVLKERAQYRGKRYELLE